ncbi:MAG TPA: transcription termination factor Rho [Thermoanaerobaculales bacterium]|nr:transcription termination factor Rho [Thermoanaerobaculales bacterium]HPA81057.1 transcription termination factor Rho [Thermoanaerobaculales bacterium]HQL30667.1 transcription termination factor Rho [Thermoanaerobaculales bacterium]HQN95679.1 transcription termination factor Rho [Thermoanaerobaculales bacterium]HQP43393.1 transcription termination factor Rho [Thermoanaerobaculales bacterium]
MDENTTQQNSQEHGEGGRRRRRRPRRRGGIKGPVTGVQGYLWMRDNGSPLMVAAERNFVADRSDPMVPVELVRPLHLESGLLIGGKARGGDRPRLIEIDMVEGLTPEDYRAKAIPFTELISIDPLERFILETEPSIVEPRVAELIAPLGKGQRCLIVSPPKAGKTTLLQQMAHAIAINHPSTTIFVLLVDERPEEVTDWKRSIVLGDVFASSSDQSIESHIQVSEMVFERARRLVEMGVDVVVFMDSLTRMARAYNNAQKGSGRIMSGGIDARTMEKPRRFFGSARNVENGGSLTVVATCLIDTGSRMDEVIFQEFKGTGNMELVLDRKLFDKRIFPCIHIPQSGTRKEEKLYPKEQIEKLYLMRRALSSLSPEAAMELLLQKVREFPTNAQFLASLQLR